MGLAVAAVRLPIPPDLFWIHAAGSGKARSDPGSLARRPAPCALPSVSSRRIRSRPV